jgi:hypothetical protein
MKRIILFSLLALVGLSNRAACQTELGGKPTPQVILGAKAYTPARDAKELVAFAKSLGLNTLFVGDQLATSVAFREECRKAGLRYFLIIRTFNDPEAAAEDPTLVTVNRDGGQGRREGDVMVSPSRGDFRRAKQERIRAAIERLQPDGVTLDYFRYFIYWEAVDPKTGPVNFPAFSFDRSSVEDFLQTTGAHLKSSLAPGVREVPRTVIEEIWSDHRPAWYQWRADRIAKDAQEFTGFIRQQFPGLPIVLHAVPWTRDEFDGAREKIVGQDLRLLAPSFDYVSPMEYSALTHRGEGWVERLNQELLKEVPSAKLLPSVEVGPDGPEFPPMPPGHYESDLKAARKAKAGVVLYHLELLLSDPVKQAITKRLMGQSN